MERRYGKNSAELALQDSSLLNIPNLKIEEKTVWRYPYESIPVLGENLTIKGIFWGPSSMAASEVAVSILSFNVSALLGALFQSMEDPAKILRNMLRLRLNRSGDASFVLNETNSGMYMIYVIDENNSTTLSALPLLVTPEEISLLTRLPKFQPETSLP